MGETPITLTLHGLTLAGMLFIIGILLHQHKVWTRMKDRVNNLWQEYCGEKDIPYVPLDNGSR
jgi:hypothetical protein